MGNAAIWWAPDTDTGVLRKISIGTRLSGLQGAHFFREAAINQSMGGKFDEAHFRAQPRAEVKIGPFRDVSLRNDLQSLENHLDRGGSCIIAEDEDRAWAAFVVLPENGDTVLVGETTPWSELGGAPSGQLVLQGPSPEGMGEWFELSLWQPLVKSITLTRPVRNDWRTRAWALLRCEGFLPQMVRAKEERNTRAMRHAGNRINYTFQLTLDMDVDALDYLASVEGAVLQGEQDVGGFEHDADTYVEDAASGAIGTEGSSLGGWAI